MISNPHRKEGTKMKKAYTIGIADGSAGGKSTFAQRLQAALSDLEVLLLPMDAYFKPEGDRPTATGRTGRSYRDDNNPESFDLPRLRRDVSDAAENGSCRVLIVEGLLTLWDCGLYEQLDLRLFVDCRADERIVRRLKRNMQWGYTFDEIADVYLDLVRTRHDIYVEPSRWKADLVINGSGCTDNALAVLASYIRTQL